MMERESEKKARLKVKKNCKNTNNLGQNGCGGMLGRVGENHGVEERRSELYSYTQLHAVRAGEG